VLNCPKEAKVEVLRGIGRVEERSQWKKIKLDREGDRQIYLEVLDRGGPKEVGILESIPFEQVTEILGQIAQRIGDSLERIRPNKACVELGVEFGLENGQLVALIARGSGKANLKVSLEWDRPESKAGSLD
jgi:hypothetical protein